MYRLCFGSTMFIVKAKRRMFGRFLRRFPKYFLVDGGVIFRWVQPLPELHRDEI